jgi:CRP/FNR family transcriptional regulator, anaerobic regulatory protein
MQSAYDSLASIPLFSTLRADDEQLILRSICRKRVLPRLAMATSGAPLDYLGVLLSGRAGEYIRRDSGALCLLRVISAGDPFGNLDPGLCDEARTSVIALEEGEILCLASPAVDKIASGNPAFRLALQTERKRQLQRSFDYVQLLTGDDSSERILKFLSLLADDFRLSDRLGRHIPVALTHQTIADSCGLTRETVSRKIGTLVDSGDLLKTDLGWVLPGRA